MIIYLLNMALNKVYINRFSPLKLYIYYEIFITFYIHIVCFIFYFRTTQENQGVLL